MGTEIFAHRLRRFGRHHHPGRSGELGEQWRERRGEHELDCVVIDDFDTADRTDIARDSRAGHRQMALDIILHRSRVEGLAVVELDARTQPDH